MLCHVPGQTTSRKEDTVITNKIDVNIERLYRLETDGSLKGFADISICKCIIVKGLRIVSGKNGLFVSMPRELGKDGKWHNRVSLINESLKDKLTELVLCAFDKTSE